MTNGDNVSPVLRRVHLVPEPRAAAYTPKVESPTLNLHHYIWYVGGSTTLNPQARDPSKSHSSMDLTLHHGAKRRRKKVESPPLNSLNPLNFDFE